MQEKCHPPPQPIPPPRLYSHSSPTPFIFGCCLQGIGLALGLWTPSGRAQPLFCAPVVSALCKAPQTGVGRSLLCGWAPFCCGPHPETYHGEGGKILFKIRSAGRHAILVCVSSSSSHSGRGGKVNISRSQVNAVNIVWIYENWLRE